MQTVIALPCRVSRGRFSDECEFQVSTVVGDNGGVHTGRVPVELCWTEHDRRLEAGELQPGAPVAGKIGARLLRIDSGAALVCVLEHQVFRVPRDTILPRPPSPLGGAYQPRPSEPPPRSW